MEKVTLGLGELDSVLEFGFYSDSQNDFAEIYVEKNTVYVFKTEGAHFDCEVLVDEDGYYNFTKINGNKIEEEDMIVVGSDFGQEELKEVYDTLILHYGFLPSYRQDNVFHGIYVDNIEFNGDNFEHFYILNEKLYLLSNSHGSLKEILNNEYEEHQYDYIRSVNINSINEFDIDVIGNKIFVSIFINNGSVITFMDESSFSAEGIIELKREIKSIQYSIS